MSTIPQVIFYHARIISITTAMFFFAPGWTPKATMSLILKRNVRLKVCNDSYCKIDRNTIVYKLYRMCLSGLLLKTKLRRIPDGASNKA
jgi:hypothetical protein